MADRFYINCPLALADVALEGPEAHHLAAVSRLRPGDHVCLFNGDGREYRAQVTAIERRRVRLSVQEIATPARELPFSLEVAAPLPKGDRAQFLVEKLTELGVTSFVPLSTRRSVVQPREARLEKLERHVIESSKQCGRNVLMRVGTLVDWGIYCRRAELAGVRLLAHQRNRGWTEKLSKETGLSALPRAAVCCAVGPEGGFADEEVTAAQEAGWQHVDLGPRVLRVETAALVLAGWTALAWQFMC
jgi:16S rRNA (uracil1498-N3)-methyltransferase